MLSSAKGSSSQRRLMKKYDIHFDEPIESSFRPPDHWSPTRSAIVRDIQKLGVTRYDLYEESISCDARNRPWREHIRRRARHLVLLSQKCLSERRNESGWRFLVEAEVVARLSVEVACHICRGRLWRSEREVDPRNMTVEEGAKRLQQRQMNRTPCVCRPSELAGDM